MRVIDEPRKGLVVARERGRQEARGELLVYVDADCRAPLTWLERIERRFARDPTLLALSGNYRFYDWDWWGRTLLRAYDFTLGPATHVLVKYILRIGVVFYGGNFAVRRDGARSRSAASTRRIEFHGEDTNLGRRLSRDRQRRIALRLFSLHVSAPLQRDGEGRGVPTLRAQLRVGTRCTTAQRIRPTSTSATSVRSGTSPSFCAVDNRKPQIRYGVRSFCLTDPPTRIASAGSEGGTA